ncbi:hypothetical protein [Streptomyces sp. NPDC057094]|uniref:hypothetical protein n=1 Tax=Streptomyces sp. NPDC057094 TaxID=3346018 RepID=UPI003641F928
MSRTMKDPEILSRFDGRGHVEFLLGGFEGSQSNKITATGFEFGYDLQTTEMPSKSTIRLVLVRNDSPTARQRAQQTQDRLRAGGPLLPTWNAPGAQPGTTRPVTAEEMTAARRGVTAYEANGAKRFALVVALLSLGCFIVAGVLRGRPGAALAVLVVFAVPLAVTAALIPRWMKRWYEKNRRLVDLYDQQRIGQVGPPPPPPGPSDRHPGTGNGQ